MKLIVFHMVNAFSYVEIRSEFFTPTSILILMKLRCLLLITFSYSEVKFINLLI